MEDVQRLIREMPEIGRKAASRSINRTATHTKTDVSKKVREKSTIKASYVKAQVSIPKKATANNVSSSVVISGKRIALIGYQISQTKKGVKARIFKGDPLVLRPRSFVAVMKTGHKGVFWRKFDSGGGLVDRLSITELTDRSIPELVNDDKVWLVVQRDADKYLQIELNRNIKFYLDKAK